MIRSFNFIRYVVYFSSGIEKDFVVKIIIVSVPSNFAIVNHRSIYLLEEQ